MSSGSERRKKIDKIHPPHATNPWPWIRQALALDAEVALASGILDIDKAAEGCLDEARERIISNDRISASDRRRLEVLRERQHQKAQQQDARRDRPLTADQQSVEEGGADFLEYAFHIIIGSNDWFGPGVYVTKTNAFDDEQHGTDLVVTFTRDGEEQPLRLAVDVTNAQQETIIEKKVDSILNGFKDGQLTSVKYFTDPVTESEDGLLMIPRVVLAMDRESTLREFKALFADFFSKHSSRESAHAAQDRLAKSTIPYAILDSIAQQLRAWEDVIATSQQSFLRYPHAEQMLTRIRDVRVEVEKRRTERAKYGKRPLDRVQRIVSQVAA